MAKVRLPPIGFWSYTRRDDERNRGQIGKLRDAIRAEIETQTGGDVPVFKDTISIPHGARFEELTVRALSDATFFIPILTPAFLQSEWCCREVRLFMDRERQLLERHPDLPRDSRIFPIHYVEVDAETDAFDPHVRDTLLALQHLNLHPYRHFDQSGLEVSRLIAQYVGSIRKLLRAQVEQVELPPPPPPPPLPPAPPPPPPPAPPTGDETGGETGGKPRTDSSIYWLAGSLVGVVVLLLLFAIANEPRSTSYNTAAYNTAYDTYDAMNVAMGATNDASSMNAVGNDISSVESNGSYDPRFDPNSPYYCPDPSSNCAL